MSAKLKIIQKDTHSLAPYVKNARTHSKKQIEQIAASIKEFGFNNPILIAENDEVIAGHGRLAAAVKLGMDKVPCIVLPHLTDAQRRAYVLADNKLAENSGWDPLLLKGELDALAEIGFNVDLIGFSEQDLASLVPKITDFPSMDAGDRAPFEQATFTLHVDQATLVKKALKIAKGAGDFGETGNENSNGNALARICAAYLAGHNE